MEPKNEYLDFYRSQSVLSSPGKYAHLFKDLPTDVAAMCGVIQGFLIHQFWILKEKNYGITAETLKAAGRDLNDEINLRSVEAMLERVISLRDRPITASRAPEQRLVGNCRDYSLLLVSMLRHRGIPARVRSGVARYFYPNDVRLEDHFICEWWNAGERRWQRTDAQIDSVQRTALGMSFEPDDLPLNQFLDAGESYVELQEGQVEPGKIGIFDFNGWMYVRYKLVSDLASLNNVEVLAWEGWGICDANAKNQLTEADLTLFSQIADILLEMDEDMEQFNRARELFTSHPQLKIPVDYKPHYFELPAFK